MDWNEIDEVGMGTWHSNISAELWLARQNPRLSTTVSMTVPVCVQLMPRYLGSGEIEFPHARQCFTRKKSSSWFLSQFALVTFLKYSALYLSGDGSIK